MDELGLYDGLLQGLTADCNSAGPRESGSLLQSVRGAYGSNAAALDGKWQLLRPGREPPEQDESLSPCSFLATCEAL